MRCVSWTRWASRAVFATSMLEAPTRTVRTLRPQRRSSTRTRGCSSRGRPTRLTGSPPTDESRGSRMCEVLHAACSGAASPTGRKSRGHDLQGATATIVCQHRAAARSLAVRRSGLLEAVCRRFLGAIEPAVVVSTEEQVVPDNGSYESLRGEGAAPSSVTVATLRIPQQDSSGEACALQGVYGHAFPIGDSWCRSARPR